MSLGNIFKRRQVWVTKASGGILAWLLPPQTSYLCLPSTFTHSDLEFLTLNIGPCNQLQHHFPSIRDEWFYDFSLTLALFLYTVSESYKDDREKTLFHQLLFQIEVVIIFYLEVKFWEKWKLFSSWDSTQNK